VQRINRYTDYPLACSEQAGKWVYGDRSFTILNNALDTSLFCYSELKRHQVRCQLGIGDSLVLGTVANLTSVKNPMGLLDIFLAVYSHNPEAKLVWVGEGNERSAIESRIHAEGLEKSVFLLGTRGDVPDILQALDVFLLPSFHEGLPVSAIEAQAAGLPCLISEKVTKEVDVTGLCHFLPIDQPNLWAHEILNVHKQHVDSTAKIMEAGYDIRTTSKWLEDFYLNISENVDRGFK